MKQYEIKKILSGPAKGRFTIIVNGWELFETFKTLEDAEREIERRSKMTKPLNDTLSR